jgi:hypothetical protein
VSATHFGEGVTRLVAKGSLPNLTGGVKPLTPDSRIADLDVLDQILIKPAAPELAVPRAPCADYETSWDLFWTAVAQRGLGAGEERGR